MVWTNDMIQKNCGSCQYFQKVPGYAICMLFDYRTQSDHGRKCNSWKGIKYERENTRQIIEKEIALD